MISALYSRKMRDVPSKSVLEMNGFVSVFSFTIMDPGGLERGKPHSMVGRTKEKWRLCKLSSYQAVIDI